MKTVNKFSSIKERVVYLIENKGLNKEDFFRKINMTSANFRGNAQKTPLNSTAIENIFRVIPEINLQWLLTGSGEPLVQHSIVQEPRSEYGKSEHVALIPLLPVEAIAGFGSGNWAITESDIQDKYLVPDFNKIDFMIRVKGSSMYPKYSSGDIVACKKLQQESFIQWNKTHVISTKEQGIMVKRIRKSDSDDCYLLVSDNKDYPPFDVPKNEITGIAIVIGTIRLE